MAALTSIALIDQSESEQESGRILDLDPRLEQCVTNSTDLVRVRYPEQLSRKNLDSRADVTLDPLLFRNIAAVARCNNSNNHAGLMTTRLRAAQRRRCFYLDSLRIRGASASRLGLSEPFFHL